MGEDPRQELRALSGAVRALLEEEAQLGGAGIPGWAEPARPSVATRGADRAQPGGASTSSPAAQPQAIGQDQTAADAARLPVGVGSRDKRQGLTLLAEEAASCNRCVLHEKRKRNVFARGSPDAQLAFVGEGPGQEEDVQGLPFVGPAGQLLDRMIAAMGLGRDEVYVCNVVKCRPPENRTPRAEEALACSRYLVPQLELVAPKVVVALGKCAADNLGVAGPTGPWRGRWGSWNGIAVLPTYHPAYLLRSPEQKRVVWEDLQQVIKRLGLK